MEDHRIGTIQYLIDTPEGREEMLRALKADDAFRAIAEIRSEIFRPARKHGYTDDRIAEVLFAANQQKMTDSHSKSLDDAREPIGTLLISRLEMLFNDIIAEYGIDLEDFG